MADLQFTVDYKQLKEANREISKVGSNAQKSASVFEAAFKKAETQSVRSARAVREQITFSQRLERQKVREANATAAAATKVANQEERLRRKYVEGYAAMDLYSKELNELAVARKADIISAEQQRQAVDRLNEEMASGTGVFSGYGAAQQAATKSSNRMGVVTQQAGYQVGDFLVQVQSGTNPMVAFGQQATQLVGILPLMAGTLGMTTAAAIGLSAALGIGIPLLTAIGAFLLRARESANKAAEGVDTLADSIESLDKSLRDYLQTKKASQLGITVEELLGTQNISEAEAELNSAREALERLITSSSVTPTGIFAGVAIIDFIKQKLATNEVTAAVLRLAQAEETLGLLRQKQGEERFSNYAEERVALQDQLAMAQEIARFGEESAQVAKLELEQRIAAYDRNIDQLVESNQLNEIHARTLKSINAEIANTEFATEEVNRNQDLIKSGAEVLNTVWSNLKAIVSDAADDAGRFADNLVLGQGYLDAAVRSGVASGAIPPQALQDLPQTDAQRAMERILDQRRRDARRPESKASGSSTAAIKESPLEKLQKELDLQRELVGQSEAYVKVRQALGDDYAKTSPQIISGLQAQYAETQKLIEIEEQRQSIIGKVESSMESALMSIVDGTKSVKDAFKSMAAEIIKELYRIYVIKRITGMVAGAFGGGSAGMTAAPVVNPMAGMSGSQMLPQAMGGAWMKGVQMFANGGVVDSPTMFGHSAGVGVMGEAGPEAIMPLKRGANGKLGVSVEGGSGSVVVNNNINVTGGSDPAAIRMEVAKLMPQITSATKSAVIDARRRGGQMRAAFN